jgi:selenide, water dikinase
MGPQALAHVVRPLADLFPAADYPQLLVGLAAPDDAAVYRLSDDLAVVATVDFFPPVVDDPYTFGAIAAANALSDIYAMGGEPLFALNLAAFPDDLPTEVLAEIFRGGGEKVREAGAVIAGGHTVMDKEPKYGLAVTGRIDPARILAKQGVRVGDRLVLTKPLGTGVITTAHKRGQVEAADLEAAVASMLHLNRAAAGVASAMRLHALTDITGFGLMGHAHEMAHLSGVRLDVDYTALPWLPGAQRYAQAGIFPGGTERNADYFGRWVTCVRKLADCDQWLLHDPQTSGGLLMAVAEADLATLLERLHAVGETAWVIGAATGAGEGEIAVR